jgi:hypothetical protein
VLEVREHGPVRRELTREERDRDGQRVGMRATGGDGEATRDRESDSSSSRARHDATVSRGASPVL